MAKLLSILQKFLKEVESENPYDLVLKGGTALSLYYFNHHRESEDLDFDADLSQKPNYKEIQQYFIRILHKLKNDKIIQNFRIKKHGFASTQRYHVKIELETYKIYETKIDVDFIEMPKKIEKIAQLCLYPVERIFITKMITFCSRKEFKDLYDLSYVIKKIDLKVFARNKNVLELIDELIAIVENENMAPLYKQAFRNVDLMFKNLKESQVENFAGKFVRDIKILRNKLR